MSTSPVFSAQNYFESNKGPQIFIPYEEKEQQIKYVLKNTKIVPLSTRAAKKQYYSRGDRSQNASFLNTFKNSSFQRSRQNSPATQSMANTPKESSQNIFSNRLISDFRKSLKKKLVRPPQNEILSATHGSCRIQLVKQGNRKDRLLKIVRYKEEKGKENSQDA